jgi:hypothetical protein
VNSSVNVICVNCLDGRVWGVLSKTNCELTSFSAAANFNPVATTVYGLAIMGDFGRTRVFNC